MNRTLLLWAGAAAIVAAIAFLGGRALRPEASNANAFELEGPAYEAAAGVAGLSKGGFSGFTEGGAEGRTVVSGKVVSVSSDSIVIEGPAGERSTLRTSGSGRPMRLEPATRDALRPGVTVLVRREPGSDVASAVLVISN